MGNRKKRTRSLPFSAFAVDWRRVFWFVCGATLAAAVAVTLYGAL